MQHIWNIKSNRCCGTATAETDFFSGCFNKQRCFMEALQLNVLNGPQSLRTNNCFYIRCK